MEISNLSDAEFKTLVIRMLKELSKDLSSIKNTQLEMKDTLIEIKNTLQGNNNRVDEAENQINDLEHMEAKNNQSTRRRKKNLKKQGECKQPLGQIQAFQHSHHRSARRRERARNWKSIWKNNERKLP